MPTPPYTPTWSVVLRVGRSGTSSREYRIRAHTESEAIGEAMAEYNNTCNEGEIGECSVKSTQMVDAGWDDYD